ncbi:3-oxoacyl-ACP synthase III [Lignipirellula cremea]|uniref:3-oxoacyl-[acyl-carrier-protein] synthase 3 n=1 Tax=Lignipirellula cremea TaxID=2528010 RepID=A0A518DSB2_9BACT|nr:3-oxoacyl-ACP synthase III [Lignipirellula cremea]QDU94724.1 3-oxoacyl-[acyl-carrier-protein] synthase 3 [Lignipirellula cremea]
MRYQQVCVESFGYTLPEEVVSSEEIESRLEPLYQRLRLPAGRLELMTGIRERRFWARGVLPSQKSIESGEKAILASGIDRSQIGVLIHASVCRDHLEPATACRVHHGLRLPNNCLIYDVSNACLGLLNGVLQVANMIELGQVSAGLVVGSEGSRELVETTINSLNRDTALTRAKIKSAVASLTIGSGSCGILLTSAKQSQTGNRLLAACSRAHSEFHELCHSGSDEAAAGGMAPLMETDSERLMHEGIATGVETFKDFQHESGWRPQDIHKTFCHQVGSGHRKMMLEALGADPARDFATLEWLGNTGSVALPITMARGLECGFAGPGDNIGMFGIGSGINCLMLGAAWQHTLVKGELTPSEHAVLHPPTPSIAAL